MHSAMIEAANEARRYLLSRYPKQQAGQLMMTTLAMTFSDMLSRTHPAAQRALADTTNDRLQGTRWRIVERVN
jgi:hypothetical protein